MRKRSLLRKGAASLGALMLAASLGAALPAAASADQAESSWIAAPTAAKAITASDTLLTTYGVRAGSAGGDFLGISNTNFDFTPGSASNAGQYTGYVSGNYVGTETAADGFNAASQARLAIFGSDANENPNPYLYNLFYNVANAETSTAKHNGTVTYKDGFTPVTSATTWMSNPNSWGDTNNSSSSNVFDPSKTGVVAGFEFGGPSIVFGATKTSCWQNFDASTTNMYAQLGDAGAYVHNDATNVWSQIYTMGQLASKADGMGGDTRYESATASAVAYEKAIKGNMLYVASKIDSGTAKKKVAYLYAIDEAAGKAYFFTPEADGLTDADDTGMSATATTDHLTAAPSDQYAANNATVSLGYMDVLPFITETYDSGTAVSGTIKASATGEAIKDGSGNDIIAEGILMRVEDIYTMSPACSLEYGTASSSELADVDVIIYNTSTKLTEENTSGGKNLSGVMNTGAYAGGLTASNVQAWASALGFKGALVGGDDYGTSTNQPVPGSADAVEGGAAPMLYCQRNYTADRDARAAWAIAQVYPELYGNNADATYGYWVRNVYHVKADYVDQVVRFMENDSTLSTYDESLVAANIKAGYDWWKATGSADEDWSGYAYYNGSTRASFYDGVEGSEEPEDTIGIFAPSAQWKAAEGDDPEPQPVEKQDQTITASDITTTYGNIGVIVGATTSGDGALSYEVTSGTAVSVNESGQITVNAAGTAQITITAAETDTYKSATKTITVTVNKAAQVVTAYDVTKTFGDAAFALEASTSGDGALSFVSGDTNVITVNGQTATIVGAGSATITATAAATSNYEAASVTFTATVDKAAQPMTFKAKQAKKVKYAKVKKANQTVAIKKAQANQGKVTYKIAKVNKAKKKFSINKTSGKITVKKGIAKGTYKVTVKATAAGDGNYDKGVKKSVITITVK